MSDVMERTLASIPRLLSSALLGGGKVGESPGRRCQPSQIFQNFVKNVDSAQGHSQEAAVVQRQLSRIKQQFEQPDCSVAQWCEHFPLLIYCSVLGYDVSFSHIYALKLAASGKGSQKRVGYLAATLLLDPSCHITILITGTLLRDLSSSNILDNLMALGAAAELTSTEHIPMMLPSVMKLLRHRQAMVRARAVCCMHAFFRRAFDVMQGHVEEVRSMLGDRNPGVLMAVVTTVELLLGHSKKEFVGVCLALISILQQIRAYKFPAHFCYHGLPLPWLQVKLIRVLSLLPLLDDEMTSSIIPLLSGILRETVGKEVMSLAILEESLMAIATLAKAAMSENNDQMEQTVALAKNMVTENHNCTEKDAEIEESGEVVQPGSDLWGEKAGGEMHISDGGEPKPEQGQSKHTESSGQKMAVWLPLLEEASRCVGSFLAADLPNLRYVGIRLLTQLVSVSAELALPHKDKVVTCLSDPDLIMRRQTLTLLHRMAVRDNFKAVCATMLKHVQRGDVGRETDVIDMVVDISHRLNSDPEWYLSTIYPLLSWRLDEVRLTSIMEDMLSFFIRSTRDCRWLDFPCLLFSTMVDKVTSCDGRGDPSVKFSLLVLRFASLAEGQAFPRHKFLAACDKLLACQDAKTELREEVVLCVQDLLLKGLLDKEAVFLWAQNLLNKCDLSLPHHFHFQLSELLRLASLETRDIASLSAQMLSQEEMDFSLSFLDLPARTVPQPSQPFLKMVYSDKEREIGGTILTPQQDSASVKSEEVQSAAVSHDNSPLYASYTESVKEDIDVFSDAMIIPGVKKRWSEHGFSGNAQRKSSAPGDSTADCRKTPHTEESERNEEEEELTEALFQGLSPLSSVTPSLPLATSHKSSMSSGFDSYTSHNSGAMSGQDIGLDVTCPSCTTTAEGMACQYDMVRFTPQLPMHILPDDSELLFSPSSPPSTSCKALHAALMHSHTLETAEIDHSALFAEGGSSTIESESNLSISDDSLEKASTASLPASPEKQVALLGNEASPSEDVQDSMVDTDDSALSLLLEAHMIEKESISTHESSYGDEGESLYSGFELLDPCAQSQNRGEVETQAHGREEW